MRPNVEECLSHPFFEKLRRPSFESTAPSIVNLDEIDSDESSNIPLNMNTLKRIISDEIKFFKHKRVRDGIQHITRPFHPSKVESPTEFAC